MANPYDRTVAELMIEAAGALDYPTTRGGVVEWFAEQYPQVKPSTIRAHIIGLTANDRNRHHYAWLARRNPLFTRHEDGRLLRFDEAGELEADDIDEDENIAAPPLEFALEAYLEEFLLSNWDRIDWGRPLEIWESASGELGHQLATPVGRLDFLAKDTATNALVVIELKRGRQSDRVVGQITRYMGWVRAELARPDEPVEGMIVAHEHDLQLAYAVTAIPGLIVLTYAIDFRLVPATPTRRQT